MSCVPREQPRWRLLCRSKPGGAYFFVGRNWGAQTFFVGRNWGKTSLPVKTRGLRLFLLLRHYLSVEKWGLGLFSKTTLLHTNETMTGTFMYLIIMISTKNRRMPRTVENPQANSIIFPIFECGDSNTVLGV